MLEAMTRFGESERPYTEDPARIMKFFRRRNLLIGQYLRSVPMFPAKIVFDDKNKDILMRNNSHRSTIPLSEQNYPRIDDSSNFYHKEIPFYRDPICVKYRFFLQFRCSTDQKGLRVDDVPGYEIDTGEYQTRGVFG